MKAEEIKFKAQREDGKGWVYGQLIHNYKLFSGIEVSFIYSDSDDKVYNVVPETICQFTTLKDKNGVEIYKGDKFQYRKHKGYILPDFTGEILFRDGCFGYVATSENMGEAFHSFSEFDELQADFLDHIEVIGNIHDKHKQKQALVDTMRGDEQIGLYDDNPKNH